MKGTSYIDLISKIPLKLFVDTVPSYFTDDVNIKWAGLSKSACHDWQCLDCPSTCETRSNYAISLRLRPIWGSLSQP